MVRLYSPMRITIAAAGLFAIGATSALAQGVFSSPDGKSTYKKADPTIVGSMTSADEANAKSRLPMLTDISQIPGFARRSEAYGTENHPFTTKGAYSTAASGAPVFMKPWRSTGKLFMRFGSSTFVCSASVIEKGILVTAAHCVHDFGQGPSGFADSVSFQPARHGGSLRFGTWTATDWIIPTAYLNGSDVCSPTAPGVVCQNDIAVVVLDTGPSPHNGKEIAQVVSRYSFYKKNQGYINFLGRKAAQITQLGYPVAFDQGLKMIRTDSLGYRASPNNVIIGSDQTGGSSGGPWLMNFGSNPSSTSSAPSFTSSNRVVATTSWGFTSSVFKVQGASRFNNNSAFPAPGATNIESLLNTACSLYPSKCF